MDAERRVVYVSGAPGAGKSMLARPLAIALGFALLSKDRFKETLCDVLAQPAGVPDRDWSRGLGGAAMELLWATARDVPRVVLGANFWPHDVRTRDQLTAIGDLIVEVHCACPAEVALRRREERARSRHRVHRTVLPPPAPAAEYGIPVGTGQLIGVDTTGPLHISELTARIRRALNLPA